MYGISVSTIKYERHPAVPVPTKNKEKIKKTEPALRENKNCRQGSPNISWEKSIKGKKLQKQLLSSMYSCKKCSNKSFHHIEKVDIWSSPDSIVIRSLLCLLPVLRCQSWVLRFVYEHRHQNRHSHNHYRILLSLQAHFDCGCKKNGQDDSRNSR